MFELTERPGHLAVVGGGPIGCELAQAFRRLGAEVTLLSDAPQLLPREDQDAAEIVRQALLRDGVRLILGAEVAGVAREGTRKILRYRAGAREDTVAADEILVAAGRVPNVEGLGLEAAGVRHTRAGVVVDDHLRTTNRRIYAAGDVCLGWKFTHAAAAAARIVVQNALFGLAGRRRASRLVMPWCTYTDPEVARVGLNEREAARARARRSTRWYAASGTWTARSPTARRRASSRCTCGAAPTGSWARPSWPGEPAR